MQKYMKNKKNLKCAEIKYENDEIYSLMNV